MSEPAMPPVWGRAVVGVDFSEPSIAAARWTARDIAPGAQLVLAHAIHVPEPPAFLRGRYPSRDQLVQLARDGAEQRLRQLASTIATGLIWTEVRVGAPDEVLAGVASEYGADLIVVGRHGDQPGLRGRLGSTAERVLARGDRPVLVVSGEPRGTPQRILAAVDDSDATAPVLEWTRALVRRFDARATVLFVIAPPLASPGPAASAGGLAAMAPPPATERELREWAMEWLGERIGSDDAGAHIAPAVLVGYPAAAILAEAEARGSELIVLGSRGHGPVRRLVLGSVSSAVLRDANRPVLVIAPGAERHP